MHRYGLLLLWMTILTAGTALAAEPVLYGRDIRPILSDRCFACHGPDREGQENDLRLDTRDAAIQGAIDVDQPASSELLARVLTDDPDLIMPPLQAGKPPLTPAEIALLKQWIEEGATYTEHWAYAPLQRPDVPASDQTANASEHPIDRFVRATLRRQGMSPNEPADRRTLIRRLSFDLTGLPPTPAEVDTFVHDANPAAVEKLIDRLLASPHYGERMAVYWLDLVRYADTGGYHSDNAREVDAFRDYVIDAFNANLPFDQFTIEQLAGDLLPDATLQQKVASGYNRLLQTTEEGGAQPKEYTAIYQADRVRNVCDVWLATTMACCQCHDHKYDPFTMRDFYSLGAFFADLSERPVGRQVPNLRLPTPEQATELAMLGEELLQLKSQPIEPEDLNTWVGSLIARRDAATDAWQVVTPSTAESSGKQQLTAQPDGSLLASGPNPDKDVYTISLPLSAGEFTGLRLEALTDDSLTRKSLSRANGNFVLTGLSVALVKAAGTETPVAIASAIADYEQPSWPVKGVLDTDPNTGWAGNGHQETKSRTAVFRFAEPVKLEEAGQLLVVLRHESGHAQHNIGRPRLSVTSQPEPSILPGLDVPAELAGLLDVAEGERTAEQQRQLVKWYRELAPALADVRQQIVVREQRQKQVNENVRTMLVAETVAPRDVRILPRGNWLDDSGAIVSPAVPERLGALEQDQGRLTRLDLARWLVRPDQPLTARVFVNRMWTLMFGRGLARSLEDFGHQGEWPTHPELLDWLAADFIESGWDVKHLLRTIALSETYQQSSQVSAEVRQSDPYNRWLARQGRFRLDAEFVRDQALAVSGLLVDEVGGPPVKPYQPAGYWQHLNFPQREWQSDSGTAQYRRGLYTFWCRSFLHPSLLAFDAPSREECVAQRPRSNTPMQALVLLNDPTYMEAARVLGARIAQSADSDTARLQWAFQQVLQREAHSAELELLLRVLAQQRTEAAANPTVAELVQTGLAPPTAGVDPGELSAWTAIARTLLNLHETITRE
ncbi:MAG: PSD1 domain-containing protein [Planctomycetaceae bacterium]|nr:PSD1 domain-containing protein [Planctomycetaceae bacterium]